MRAVPSLLLILTLPAACAPVAVRPIADGVALHEGRAGIGQSIRIGTLALTPTALVEDSRCPTNVHCVWAGRVVVRVRIDGPGWRETKLLELGKSIDVRRHRIAFTSAVPERTAGEAPPATAYRFGFSVP